MLIILKSSFFVLCTAILSHFLLNLAMLWLVVQQIWYALIFITSFHKDKFHWGMSFVFVSNKSGWLSDSMTHTSLKIFGAPSQPCLEAYSYIKTPSCLIIIVIIIIIIIIIIITAKIRHSYKKLVYHTKYNKKW